MIAAVEGRLLDPATAITVKGVTPRPTVYVGPRLVVSKAVDFEGALRVLRAVAEPLGWDVVPEPEDPRTAGLRFGVRAVRIVVASNRATIAPDGWIDYSRRARSWDDDIIHGAHWWTWDQDQMPFGAHGFEGQRVICFPTRDVVVVRLGLTPSDGAPALNARITEIAGSFPELG